MPLPQLQQPPYPSPGKQTGRTEDEAPHDDPVLDSVALEAVVVYVLELGVLADGEVVAQAEGFVALSARGGSSRAGEEEFVIVVLAEVERWWWWW